MRNQIEWEKVSHALGADRFLYGEKEAFNNERFNTSVIGNRILSDNIQAIADLVEEYLEDTGKALKYTREIKEGLRVASVRSKGNDLIYDYRIVAYISLLTVLQRLYCSDYKDCFLTNLSALVGRRCELDQRLYSFKCSYPAFVNKIQDSIKEQNVTSSRHIQLIWSKKWKQHEDNWEPWSKERTIQIGSKLIEFICKVLPEYIFVGMKQKGKHQSYIVRSTKYFDDYVTKQCELVSFTQPTMRPFVEPPLNWVKRGKDVYGAFHTPAIQHLFPFIKTKGKKQRKFVQGNFPTKHIQAVNHLQKTVWRVNQPVYEVIQESLAKGFYTEFLPRYFILERPQYPERLANLPREQWSDRDKEDVRTWKMECKIIAAKNKQNAVDVVLIQQSLQMARELMDQPIWYPYNCDFRGRIYCGSASLSPQGPDHIRALIHFAEGKPLTRRGLIWLAIHGANKYGVDKVNHVAQVQWVADNKENIRAVVNDPLSDQSREFLGNADKPFQFLAFCYEWDRCNYGTDPTALSYIPVGLDSSCNGIQHYAALLLDQRGGIAVNLAPSDKPQDIYTEVTEAFRRLLKENEHEPMAKLWLNSEFDRKLSKVPVMTLPYGSTLHTCRMHIRNWVKENPGAFNAEIDGTKQWEAAVYAAPIMWRAIKEEIVSAREGMVWLKECTSKILKAGFTPQWINPVNFPVMQHYPDYSSSVVHTDMFGKIHLKCRQEELSNSFHQNKNGIAPNFIHSMDSAHLVRTILRLKDEGINSIQCIHDDYGTHACDTDFLFRAVREEFVSMYTQRDWLMSWKKEQERLSPSIKLDDPPAKGTLDITGVLNSKYFFT